MSSPRETEGLLADVVAAVDASLFVVDTDGRYLLMNDQAKALLGLDRETVVGRTNSELLPEALAAQFDENNQQVFDSGDSVSVEQSVPTAHGEHTYLKR